MSDQHNVSEKEHQSALVLANVAALAVAIIKKTAGNDISTAINGSTVTREVIQNLTLHGVQARLEKRAAPRTAY